MAPEATEPPSLSASKAPAGMLDATIPPRIATQGSDRELREKAHRKAETRYTFRIDAAVYVLVDAFLVECDTSVEANFHGSYSSSAAGHRLAYHYSEAYGCFAEDWVERETQRILEPDKKK
jgi:hypothetical protein